MTNYKNNTLSFFLVPSCIDTMVWQHVRWLNHDHLGMEIRRFPKGSRFCSLRQDVCIYSYVHVITLSLDNMRLHPAGLSPRA